VTHYFEYVWEQFGLPLAVGWIPWALIGGWVGYRLSLRIIRDRRQRIRAKRVRQSPAAEDTTT